MTITYRTFLFKFLAGILLQKRCWSLYIFSAAMKALRLIRGVMVSNSVQDTSPRGQQKSREGTLRKCPKFAA